jgi:hypothetical protein
VDTVVEPCEDCVRVLEALFIVLVNRDWDIDDHVAVRLVQERPASRGGSEVKWEPAQWAALGRTHVTPSQTSENFACDSRWTRHPWYSAVSAGVCAKHCFCADSTPQLQTTPHSGPVTRLLSGLVQLLLQRLQHRVAFVSTRHVSSHAGATRRAEVVPMRLQCAFLGLDQHPLPAMSIEKLNQSARLLARRPRVGHQRRNDGSSDGQQGPACSGGVAAASTSADGSRRCKHGPAERATNWTETDDVALRWMASINPPPRAPSSSRRLPCFTNSSKRAPPPAWRPVHGATLPSHSFL